MPTREEIDLELLKFLREQKSREKREDDGVRNAIQNLSSQVQLLGQKLDANHTITSERIAGLAARVDKLEEDVDDTGVHNIQQLTKERDEARSDLRKYVAAAIVALLSGGGVVELLHQLTRAH